MIESLFIVFLIIATCAFLAAFTTAKKNLRLFLMTSAFVLLGALGFIALNIEHINCEPILDSIHCHNITDQPSPNTNVLCSYEHYHWEETNCRVYPMQDWTLAYISWGYSLIALLALLVTSIQAYDPSDGTLL